MNLECIEGEHTPTSGERREGCIKSRVFPNLVADDDGPQEISAFACVGK